MPSVTECLVQLIAKQVDEKGLVVWYDPERAYVAAAAELSLPNTTVVRYEGSFLQLAEGDRPFYLSGRNRASRPVVYVPIERTSETDGAA